MKKCLRYALLSLLVLLSLFIPSAFAATSEAVNIITNPGEDMSTMMNISYQTASTVTGTRLEYTLATDTDWSDAVTVYPETSVFAPKSSETVGTKTITSVGFSSMIDCDVSLEGLTPGTSYMYRAGKLTMSDIHYFKTAEGDTSNFTFLALSDPQYGSLTQAGVFNTSIQKALALEPDIRFSMFAGDVVDRGGRYEQWQWLFAQKSTTQMTFAVTPGNHEYYDGSSTPVTYDATYYNGYYNNPQNGAEGVKNSSYYFMYNGVLFFSIDSEAAASDYDKAVAEQEWFKKVMETHTARYVIVTMHRSFYGYIYGEASVAVRGLWQDIFDDYGVDFVYTGHDHIYSRTGYIYEGVKQDGTTTGTVYVTGGSAGQKSYAASQATAAIRTFNAPFMAIDPFVKTEMLSMVTVTENEIKVKALDQSGNVLDSYTISRKASATVDPDFTKAEFEATTTLASDGADLTTIILTLGKGFLGNVARVKVNINGKTIGENYIRKESQGVQTFTGFRLNCVWPVTIDITYKDGTTAQKSLIYATKPTYGSISDVKLTEDDVSASLSWKATLENDQITSYAILLNDEAAVKLTADATSYLFPELNPAHENTIVFQALDGDNRVRYTETIKSGTAQRVAHVTAWADEDVFTAGSTTQIHATANQTGLLLYSSSDEAILTVDANGLVTAHAAGDATVNIWLARRSDTMIHYEFTVLAPVVPPTDPLVITASTNTLVAGTTLTLESSRAGVSWSSSDEAIATVDADGVVKALASGTVTITASIGDDTATVILTVTAAKKKGCKSATAFIIPSLVLAFGVAGALAFRRKKELDD